MKKARPKSKFYANPGMRRGKAPESAAPVLEPEIGHYAAAKPQPVPLIAICGRPNVGKSTLFNRIVGSRRAIVGDEPGITRDRLYGEANWRGRDFRVVDTGGVLPGVEELIPTEIFTQAKVALAEAAAIVMVVDGRTELAQPDMELARLLIRGGKPLFLAVNKIDTFKLQAQAEEYRSLGITQMIAISAEHGSGIDDLLDGIIDALKLEATPRESKDKSLAAFPTAEQEAEAAAVEAAGPQEEIRVAIIGHPNVGKSTLLNRMTGTTRSIVSPIPGTTRDAVDELIEHDGEKFRIIDTAGIRRKSKTNLMAEKMSVVMARKHLEAADIALMVVDATEGVNALDANIAGYAHESGRSVIIVVNKWDLIAGKAAKNAMSDSRAARLQQGKRPNDQNDYEKQLRYDLKFLNYAPVVFISAVTGRNMDQLFKLLTKVAAERRKRVTTSEMNRFIETVDFDKAAVPAKHKVRVFYMTQAAVAPPTFVLFVDRDVKMHFSYERFLENQIREAFGFIGAPIWLKLRPKNKSPRNILPAEKDKEKRNDKDKSKNGSKKKSKSKMMRTKTKTR